MCDARKGSSLYLFELTELHWRIMGKKFPLALTSGVQTQQACIHHSVAPQGRLSEKKLDCEVTKGSVPVNLLVGMAFHGLRDLVPARRLGAGRKEGI